MQKEKKVLLTISLLVSGREETTIKCLDSLTPIMQEIPSELILVDTGCSQELKAKLQEYTQQIIPFTWCNDFSKARNAGLERANGEWFLYLDDDEWFVECDELIDFFKSGEYKEYHRANYIQRNFQDTLLTYYSDSWVSRMIRMEEDTHFERNSVLLLDMIQEEPQRLRWKVQLVQEYRGIKAWNDLYSFSRKCLDETKQMDSLGQNRDIGSFYVGAVEGLLFLEKNKEAEKIANQGLADERMSMLCKTHLLLQLGVVYYREGKLPEAKKALMQYLDHYQYLIDHEEELYVQQGVLLVEEAVDVISVKKAYSILICCGLKKKNTSYLKKYYHKLEWEKNVIYVCDDLTPVLLEAMSSMPVEDIFVSVWRDVWKNAELRNTFMAYINEQKDTNQDAYYQMLELVSVADIEDEYTLYANLLLIQKESNPQRLFACLQNRSVSTLEQMIPDALACMDERQLTVLEKMCENEEPENAGQLFLILLQRELLIRSDQAMEFEALRERFATFSSRALDLLTRYYQPVVFETYLELLPAFGQAAQLLATALQLEETDMHKALEIYREVVAVDAAYANTISCYMRLLGDNFSPEKAQNELEELKENVLLKVYEKVKEHQFQDAIAILVELKKVIPDDLNIAMMALEIRLSLLQSK